jgi:hypothetical protein
MPATINYPNPSSSCSGRLEVLLPKTTIWNWVPRLRKFLKMALLVCLAIAALPAAMAIMIFFWIWSGNAEADKI